MWVVEMSGGGGGIQGVGGVGRVKVVVANPSPLSLR